MFRKIIFWLHLTTAVLAGAIILIMSLTGVLLVYEKQMQEWADLRGLNGAPPVADAAQLPVAQLVARANAVSKGKATSVRWRSAANAPVEVVFGPNSRVFLNGYTGEVLGTGATRLRAFFHKVTDWHRWLALSGGLRERGRAITSAANAGFLFIIISGFYLWWPRNWTGSAFRNVMWFRRGLRAKARDFNWHNVIGLWSLVPLFFIVASGVVISYPPVGDAINRVLGDGAGARAALDRAGPPTGFAGGTDALIARAKAHDPEWRTLSMQLAPTRGGGVSFTIDRSQGGQPQKRALLVLASNTGEIVRWEPFAATSKARQARSLIRFAHTGEVAGLTGQTIAGIACVAVLFLVYTGISLALRRLFAWRGRSADIVSPPVTAARRQHST